MIYTVTGKDKENLMKRINIVKEAIEEDNEVSKLNGWILYNNEPIKNIVDQAIKNSKGELVAQIYFRELPLFATNYHGMTAARAR